MKKPIKNLSPDRFPVETVMGILAEAVEKFPTPYVTECAEGRPDPFKVLIATILSLRTRDLPTAQASRALFALADTPEAMARLPLERVAEAVKPSMYYLNKAQAILGICRSLVEEYGGRVPDEIDELLKFKGVGRKTANLVVTLGYGKPGICVDTHVHRITNRWGLCHTKTPDETEMSLRKILPEPYWIPINDWLVRLGQNMCKPISPLCSQCPLVEYCQRVGVTSSR